MLPITIDDNDLKVISMIITFKVLILFSIVFMHVFTEREIVQVEVDKILFLIAPLFCMVGCFMACHGILNESQKNNVNEIESRNVWRANIFNFLNDPQPLFHLGGYCALISGLVGVGIDIPRGGKEAEMFLLEVVIGVSILISQHFAVKLFIWQNRGKDQN